jgi:hypothetical protein
MSAGSGGIGGASPDTGGSGGSPESVVEPYSFAEVQEFMLTWNCRGCHEGSDGPDPRYPRDSADLYELLSTVVAPDCGERGLILIVPGDPQSSALVAVLEGRCMPAVPQMPPMEFGPATEEVAAVSGWVQSGAPE